MVSEIERHNPDSRLEPYRVADDQNPMVRVTETTAHSHGAKRRVIPGDDAQALSSVEVTAVSHNSGTERTQEDTRGHDELGD